MKCNADIIGAFSDYDASRLSGVSQNQLRHWHRSGLLPASFDQSDRSRSFGRIYSFLDLVALRVLNRLRNEFGVSLQELRKVSEKLEGLGPTRWTSQTLYVLGKKVVFDDPESDERREIVSGQRVFDIPLKAAISDTRKAIEKFNARDQSSAKIVSQKFLMNNEPVFSGTRIHVSAVVQYFEADFSFGEILKEFPDLSEADLRLAWKKWKQEAA